MNPQSVYQEISERLRVTDEAQSAKMFGMPCLKIAGKAFAGLHQDQMVFKLRGGILAEVLALEGAKLFDPMGGRPMKEWVLVPFTQAGRWQELAGQALALQREING